MIFFHWSYCSSLAGCPTYGGVAACINRTSFTMEKPDGSIAQPMWSCQAPPNDDDVDDDDGDDDGDDDDDNEHSFFKLLPIWAFQYRLGSFEGSGSMLVCVDIGNILLAYWRRPDISLAYWQRCIVYMRRYQPHQLLTPTGTGVTSITQFWIFFGKIVKDLKPFPIKQCK